MFFLSFKHNNVKDVFNRYIEKSKEGGDDVERGGILFLSVIRVQGFFQNSCLLCFVLFFCFRSLHALTLLLLLVIIIILIIIIIIIILINIYIHTYIHLYSAYPKLY